MHGRNHDRSARSWKIEELESRQLMTVSALWQDPSNAAFVGPVLPELAAQQAVPLNEFAASVVGRQLFYNQSKFDGANAGVDASDDAAIAPDKSAYIPSLTPGVTVDPFVLVAQGVYNADLSNPEPQDDRYFKGFPSMEVLPSGRMICVFDAADSHGGNDTQARWTYSDDGGATWSSPVTLSILYDGSPITAINPESIWRIPAGTHTGRLLLSFWNADDPAKSRVAWSDDEGQTWSASVAASDPNPTFSTYHYGGHPIQLADGSLLASGYAHITDQAYYVASTIRSTDGGANWSPWSTIASGAGTAKKEQPEEPCLLLMDNGQILCTVREDTTKTIRTYINTDGTGASWTEIAGPTQGAFRGFGKPALVQDDQGTVICITRSALTTYPVFFVSRDHGATWGPEQSLGQGDRYFAYGDMRAVGDGRIAVVYGAQSTTNRVRSDVRFTYLNDTQVSTPATFHNISSYARGINGIMIDLQGTHGTLTASDFVFKVGNNNTPSTWAAAPAPASVVVRTGEGLSGSDRLEIVWNASNAPKNTWLEVIVKGDDAIGGNNTNTGLTTSDVFFFGSRVGDSGSGSATSAVTSLADEQAVRNNLGAGASITNLYDYDRNGSVQLADGLAARNNTGTTLKISVVPAPAAPQVGPLATLGEADEVAASLSLLSKAPAMTIRTWITERLVTVDPNSGPIVPVFTQLTESNTPRAKSLLVPGNRVADKLGSDNRLLDSLFDELGL